MLKDPGLGLTIAIVILCIALTLTAVATFARQCTLPHPNSPQSDCDQRPQGFSFYRAEELAP